MCTQMNLRTEMIEDKRFGRQGIVELVQFHFILCINFVIFKK